MKVLWTRKAYSRAEEIYAYIERDSPARAGKWIQKLLDKVDGLAHAPRMGRKLPEIESSAIRELLFGNYGIVYKIKGETIYILTVRHFRQILPLGEVGEP